MPKPNNPYSRPVSATKESAKTIGEYYGTRATDKTHINASGGRSVSSASRFQAVGNAYEPPAPTGATRKAGRSKPVSEPVVTAEDLFG
jgi:hypothetical protein